MILQDSRFYRILTVFSKIVKINGVQKGMICVIGASNNHLKHSRYGSKTLFPRFWTRASLIVLPVTLLVFLNDSPVCSDYFWDHYSLCPLSCIYVLGDRTRKRRALCTQPHLKQLLGICTSFNVCPGKIDE